MKNVILLRYGEIHLKGKNRGFFEKMLIENVEHAVLPFNALVKKISGRYVISNFSDDDADNIINALKNVAGLYSVSKCTEVLSDKDVIYSTVVDMCKDMSGTMKVETNRADKKFPINSMDLSKDLGGYLLENNPNLKVDIHHPEIIVNIDIRESGNTYIFTDTEKCIGGLPVGSAGKGLLLLSGGIDSPVAGYMMAKRGVKLSALHFHSFPYTSHNAREKVIDLAKLVSKYNGSLKIYMVSFTEIQENIHEKCDPDYMITIMRRFMMRVAEYIARENFMKMIITGESLGQVASQTIESMTVIGEVIKEIPLIKPLVAFDKSETIEIARRIGTYDTSIKPFDDCCTVFLPKTPATKPNLKHVLKEEAKLNVEELFNNCLKTIEIVEV